MAHESINLTAGISELRRAARLRVHAAVLAVPCLDCGAQANQECFPEYGCTDSDRARLTLEAGGRLVAALDAAEIADALETFAGIDDGANTDWEQLHALAARMRPPKRRDPQDGGYVALVSGGELAVKLGDPVVFDPTGRDLVRHAVVGIVVDCDTDAQDPGEQPAPIVRVNDVDDAPTGQLIVVRRAFAVLDDDVRGC